MSTITIRKVLATAAVVAGGLPAVGAPVHAAESANPGQHHPTPSHFTQGRVTNPYYPLKPGTVFVYQGLTDGQPGRDVMIVTRRTRVVDGVRCRVVLDRLTVNGEPPSGRATTTRRPRTARSGTSGRTPRSWTRTEM